MPTLTTSEHLTAKSILRHRPITPTIKYEEPPRVPRASLTQTRKPTATTNTNVPVDVPVWTAAKKSQAHAKKPQAHLHTIPMPSIGKRIPLVGIGIGMVIAVLVVFLGQLLIGWIGNTLDDIHYGYPRTYQTDAVVGHNDSQMQQSHFIALNLKGQIEVIELPGGDASHAKIYLGPHLYGTNADLAPVTLQFVENPHTHLFDMLVLMQGETIVFQNAQGQFHAPAPPVGS